MSTPNKRRPGIRALILTGDLGDGHRQAARALAEARGAVGRPQVETEVVDYMQEVYTLLHPVIKYGFLHGVEKLPFLYGYFYRRSRESMELSAAARSFLRLGQSRLEELLKAKQPDLVICTFPLAAAAVSLLKEKGRCSAALVTVITDYADHALWVQPHTDLFLVGSEKVARALEKRGIAESRISVTGIPVRTSFFGGGDRASYRSELGLDPKRQVVLVMGGGWGLMTEETRSLIRSPLVRERLQLVFLCGSNEKARRLLEKELASMPTPHVRILGFTEEVHRWMGSADLLLTKPGGLTTSEAIASGLPMLLYKPIPGQEEENAKALVEAGVAIRASKDRRLLDQLLELAQSKAKLEEMRLKAGRLRREQPVRRAWAVMLKLPVGSEGAGLAVRPAVAVRESMREAW
ncbi:processive 1,2-diacylglycerol beta-glucosyltransferase [Paenibacillus sp. UNCCL117]|uniref:MGDG synthase family glycosyltransferase n=1 Tax=unclassified Paenibacillus TaxID=185978 RepID=UPI00088B2E6E|nr:MULTISPECIES: glycosyltransferase [unclassified Paenibacillus]SDD77794.1 Monogalactosyldiacylglycerol synthase [Paenibacillus sp. cl123]SFW52823.1 processive 1,2-diacylglycerol beta-glucosyltransferase [Paenibacillus sp. UNCCL117]